MIKRYFLILLIFMLILSSCTVPISQQPLGAPTAPAGSSLTPPAPTAIKPTQPIPTPGFPTPFSIPVTWSALHLAGKLIYVVNTSDGYNNFMDVQSLDLGTGAVTTLFQSVPDGYIDSAVVSPDLKQIIISYAPPYLQQGTLFNPLALFSMPVDGSQPPQQLFPLPLKNDQEIEPVWSPDGKSIYFVLVNNGVPPAEPNQHYPIYQIYRVAYPDGQPEKILEKAYWPRPSADGSQLVYVSENPDDMTNQLFVANSDGSNPHQIMLSGAYVPRIIDAPMFLPDGKTILFSAPTPPQSSAIPWLGWLFGARPASAHTLSSEWWSVPVSGGAITQLTHIQTPGLYASISPDNRTIVSFSTNRIFVMNPDGTDLTMLISDTGGNMGTVNWIP